ncbi:hypothetical protein [Schleiferia thermophila]
MKTLYSHITSKICFLLLLILSSCKSGVDTSEGHVLDFIAPQAVMLGFSKSVNTLNTALKSSQLAQPLKNTQWLKELKTDAEYLRLALGDSMYNSITNQPVHAALLLSGARKYGWLFLVPVSSSDLKFNPDRDNYIIDTSDYESSKIYHLTLSNGRRYYISLKNKVGLLSRHRTLIEEALRTSSGTYSVRTSEGFSDMYKTLNRKDPLNLLINLREFSHLSKSHLGKLHPKWLEKTGLWAAFDLHPTPDRLQIDGLIQVPDSAGLFISTLSGNYVSEKKLQHLPVPSFANAFVYFNLENYATYQRKYLEYLEQTGRLKAYRTALETEFKTIPFQELKEILRGEFGIFYGTIPENSVPTYFFRVYNASKFIDIAWPDETKKPLSSYRGYEIWEIRQPALIQHLYSLPVSRQTALAVIVKDFILLCPDETFLYSVLNALEDNKLLTVQEPFEKLLTKTAQPGHIIAFAKEKYFETLLQNSLINKAPVLRDLLNQLPPTGQHLLSLTYINKSAVVSLTSVFGREEDKGIRQLWTLKTEKIIFGPVAVTNHMDNSQEFIFQDEGWTLHACSPEGRRLWQKKLDAPILYTAQWDMFKNGRLQHVVVTSNSVYVIDRNGNDVKPWPKKFNKTITAAALFDYDKNKNYRLIIGEGTTVHNLDVSGNPVKGWQFTSLKAPLAYHPKHYFHKGLDYLVFQSADGAVFITDRAGNSRLKGAFPAKTPYEVQLVFPADGQPWYIQYLKANGEQVSYFQNGRSDSIQLLQVPDYGLISHNEVFSGYASRNQLIIKDRNGFFEKKLPFSITEAPELVRILGKNFYSVAGAVDEKIALFHSNGLMVEGFPVYGTSTPIILQKGKNDPVFLVTKGAQGYLIGYEISQSVLFQAI